MITFSITDIAIMTAVAVVVFGPIVWLNIHVNRNMAKLTPEERKRLEQEIREDAQIW